MTISWRDFVMSTIETTYRPGQRFSYPGFYQRLRASPLHSQVNDVEEFEATVRATMNSLVKEGRVERTGRGEFRLPA